MGDLPRPGYLTNSEPALVTRLLAWIRAGAAAVERRDALLQPRPEANPRLRSA